MCRPESGWGGYAETGLFITMNKVGVNSYGLFGCLHTLITASGYGIERIWAVE